MEEREMYFEIFRKDFNKSNEAKKYLSSRNLSSKIYNDSQIGFCIAESTYKFSLLKGRLIVPIRNVHGELIAMAGRQIPNVKDQAIKSLYEQYSYSPNVQQKIDKWNKGKWINEPYTKSKNLYFLDIAKNQARVKNYIFVCEGYFDCLSFYDNGIKNICALCGTSITEYQVALISRFCENVFVLMDSDGPGKIASEKVATKVKENGLVAYKIYLPEGLDPDDFAQSYDIGFLEDLADKMIKEKIFEMSVTV
jgi:DNA primase